MKTRMFVAFGILVQFSCMYEPPKVADLPLSVDLGETVYYLNGEKIEVRTPFEFKRVGYGYYGFLNLSFVEDRKTSYRELFSSIQNEINIGDITNRTDWQIYSPNDNLDVAIYERDESVSSFFTVTLIDTINLEVAGRFDVTFKRVSTLEDRPAAHRPPLTVICQGVFHEKYTEY